ncbi:MAG: diaminopimelate epimerase [bacterium]|nr:diaminopimelate epimerase [bacterium]MCP4800232.1 diaminopimelate epimerase [bacterium]
MATLKFTKMHGAGNDFIVISDLDLEAASVQLTAPVIEALCNRQLGIGADGLIIVAYDFELDFKMIYFNSDGYEAEMCGNGARCAFAFANKLGMVSDIGVFATGSGPINGSVGPDFVKVSLPPTKAPDLDYTLDSGSKVHLANTGVPHAVLISDSVSEVNLKDLGPHIRYDAAFEPDGANVNWVEKLDNNSYKIRTYERGVEAETLACGTGASASALVLYCLGQASTPVALLTEGGDKLVVDIEENDGLYNLNLTGPATIAFTGEVEIND